MQRGNAQRFWTWGDWLGFSLPIIATLLVFGTALLVLPVPEADPGKALAKVAPHTLTVAQATAGEPPLANSDFHSAAGPRHPTDNVDLRPSDLAAVEDPRRPTEDPREATEDPRERMARLARFAPVNILASRDRPRVYPSSPEPEVAEAPAPPRISFPTPQETPPPGPPPGAEPRAAEPAMQVEPPPESPAPPVPVDNPQQLGAAGAATADGD